jgi:hypothetical protein
MRNCGPHDEALCETSEEGERLFSQAELEPISFAIGRRVLEIFGYRSISSIVFRLKSTSREVRSVVSGGKLPSAELLLAIAHTTGASIDWLLTGEGTKYLHSEEERTATITILRPRRRARNNAQRSRVGQAR